MARETTIIRAGEPSGGGGPGGSDRGYVDWGAILAGAVIAAGSSVVLTTFATALGLGSISVDGENNVSSAGLILTALFTVFAMVGCYMLGGYVAGRMRRGVGGGDRDETTARDGIHGLVVWALGMIAAGVMATNLIGSGAKAVGSAAGTAVEAAGSAAGGLAQGAGQLVGGLASGAGQAAAGVADANPGFNPVGYIRDTLLRPGQPGAGAQGDTVGREMMGILGNVVRTGEISDADRAYMTQLVAQQTGLAPAEVDARVNSAIEGAKNLRAEAQQKIDEAKARADEAAQKAKDAAESARKAGVLSAFLLTASALIAAVAAYIGAVRGGRHRDESKLWGGLRYHR